VCHRDGVLDDAPVISVVIPAHDESTVIERCLRALLTDATEEEFDIVVVANGCTDDTAARARSVGGPVTVVEEPVGGKINALAVGDRVAHGFPRIYLDADVELSTTTARAIADALRQGPALAAGARPRLRTEHVSSLVRWHYEAWLRLPVLNRAYLGSGVYAVSAEGHRRISPWPQVVADDEYVRRRFRFEERISVPEGFDVHLSRTVRAYVRRAVRARRGNADLTVDTADVLPDDSPRGLRPVLGLLRNPRNLHRVLAFVTLTTVVRVAVLLDRGSRSTWHRDTSSRPVPNDLGHGG
jgi:glycosyltransferase involved in cell wall biosynthesis